ncbi:MAG TPA: endo alpha-1,4 polygalactosaminidase [Polyangiaceae bacterium]|jgi:hypothetical protein
MRWIGVLAVVACSSAPQQPGNDAGADAVASADTGATDDAATDAPAKTMWAPALGERWQYQLQGDVNASITAAPNGGGAAVAPIVFDIDLYASDGTTPNAAGVSKVHGAGAHAICYVDAGTYENFRPDAADYTTFDSQCGGCLLGKNNGWPGEQWLDVNDDKGQKTFILAELAKRVDKCVAANFDGVEFDNVDGYSNDTGFTIAAQAQEDFDKAIAALAHQKGLSVALKNDVDQVSDLAADFDYAVNEQCYEFTECDQYAPFLNQNKAVFNVEYNVQPSAFCAPAITAKMSAIKKELALDDTPWTPCN